MTNRDFTEHNREVAEVWTRFYTGDPIRMPVIVGVSDRYFMMDPRTNPHGISFREYSQSPEIMFRLQCGFDPFVRAELPGDHEMGVPESGWTVNVDFQNYYEAAWLGAEVAYPEGEVPYAVPLLRDENKNQLFHAGIPDPFGGFMATAREYYDRFNEWAPKTSVQGQVIGTVGAPFAGTDGMFTIACELRGAERLCMDIYDDPAYVHELMAFLTEATVTRIRVWRRYRGEPLLSEGFGLADDSIALLSCEAYREFVLPYHLQMKEALSPGAQQGFLHACGDATRHFKMIQDELSINVFDTGFPVNHAALVQALAPGTIVQGGVPASLVQLGTPQEIDWHTKEILDSVKPLTKSFIFREGNDIPPGTSLENMWALYEAGKRHGLFQ